MHQRASLEFGYPYEFFLLGGCNGRNAASADMSLSETHKEEIRRVAALRRYGILDTAPEPQFDDIAELARALFDATIALISLVDKQRQWLKAHLGLHHQEMPRSRFCAEVIRASEVLLVADARQDERFRNDPLVTNTPRIRFYAGAPLRSPDGFNLGALCVMDPRPRPVITQQQTAMLSGLARLVVREIESRPQVE